MFPEHVEQSFLDPEYSFDEYFQLGLQRKVGPIKNQLASPNTSNYFHEETFTQLRMGFSQLGFNKIICQLHAGKQISLLLLHAKLSMVIFIWYICTKYSGFPAFI